MDVLSFYKAVLIVNRDTDSNIQVANFDARLIAEAIAVYQDKDIKKKKQQQHQRKGEEVGHDNDNYLKQPAFLDHAILGIKVSEMES